MGCSHVVHAGASVLASFAGLTTMNKVQHAKLKREIETMCNIMQPEGVIAFNWSGSTMMNQDMVKYTCTVSWKKRATVFDRSPKSYFGPKVSYISLVEAHTYASVKHFWELYQREPRFDIQVLVLNNLVKICGDTMARRYGPDWREKALLKSQGADVALDEKRAYSVLHTMGGPSGGGEWIHVPAGCDLPDPHMRFPPFSGPRGIEAPKRARAAINDCQYEIDELETGDERADEMDDIEHFQVLKRRVTNKGRLLPDASGSYGQGMPSDQRSSMSGGHRRAGGVDSSNGSSLADGEAESHNRPRHKRQRHVQRPDAGSGSSETTRNRSDSPVEKRRKDGGIEPKQPRTL
ncbi:hypothetical protein SLS58_001062 [Diplodia intermedia]|uniref:Uncharacterized protein n=1 Tax=Diplodia intermedia TaxID=856260 RepID=A0ABR3U2C8_9PEZI